MPTVNKAKISCENSGEKIKNHFSQVRDMIKIATGTVRETIKKGGTMLEELPKSDSFKKAERRLKIKS